MVSLILKKKTYADSTGLVTEAGVAEDRSVTDVKVRDHVTGGDHLFYYRAVVGVVTCKKKTIDQYSNLY